MLKFGVILLAFLLCASFVTVKPASAAENPLAVANNKIGIHVLDPSELPAAAKLVNNNGGDWGYVTIPIQSAATRFGVHYHLCLKHETATLSPARDFFSPATPAFS